ncbi:MAG: pyridoxine 5'-phosphate synthase [Candidatus Kaelpia aquatica]|nr:pyridoxine 5'-phosphate synthase [Candidatus Kaelpia aquatica]
MRLGLNIDHVATVREARGGDEPNPIKALLIAEKSGCDSIVAHLREDRRHINDSDIREIKINVKTTFNMEMSIAEDIVRVALDVKPDEVTLVPERREELTTEGGLDVLAHQNRLADIIPEFKKNNIRVSLFIDPDREQIEVSSKVGADYIEIHTGSFAEAFKKGFYREELDKIVTGVEIAKYLNLKVNAGHGLNYENVSEIVKIEGIESLNIGHSIISRAIFSGIESAVVEMLKLIK